MRQTQSNYNPLEEILGIFPNQDPKFLTHEQLEKVKNLLDLGGVHCEDLLEVITCLKVLHKQGVLTVDEWYKNIKNTRETSYFITRNI